jgi:carboxypeptidase Taq
LPEAWNKRYRQDQNSAWNQTDGCMQDVHWYGGRIGGSFQGYTLGNIFSSMFFNSAMKARTQILEDIRLGKFSSLHSWLKENIYQHGSKFTAEELVQRATGGPITIAPYITYLKSKYGELYDL